MMVSPRPDEKFYNEKLAKKLKEAYQRADIGKHVLAELLGVKSSTAMSYLLFTRSITRSDVERRAVVAIKLLNKMVNDGVLPLGLNKKDCRRTEKHLQAITEYMEKLNLSFEHKVTYYVDDLESFDQIDALEKNVTNV